MSNDVRDRLVRAIALGSEPSSDFDLNPGTFPAQMKARAASVLIVCTPSETGIDVFLTKRSSALKHHPGQIAFPGGKLDAGDATVVDAALREAHEEIGLSPDAVDVLGTLSSHRTVTGFDVTPVLAWLPRSFSPVPEPNEVDEVFVVPLDHVTDQPRFTVQSRRWRGSRRAFFTVPYGPYYIWGATARILRGLADRYARCG